RPWSASCHRLPGWRGGHAGAAQRRPARPARLTDLFSVDAPHRQCLPIEACDAGYRKVAAYQPDIAEQVIVEPEQRVVVAAARNAGEALPARCRSCDWCRAAARRAVRARIAVAGAELALHQDRVEPAAELEPDRLQRADEAKAGILVKLDRSEVGAVADHRDHLAKVATRTLGDERTHQRAPDALTLVTWVD